jgi:uncharacterized protein (DUF302 family)
VKVEFFTEIEHVFTFVHVLSVVVSRMSTILVTFTLSVADPAIVVFPELGMTAPLAGLVMFTVGAVVSGGVTSVTVICVDVPVFPE